MGTLQLQVFPKNNPPNLFTVKAYTTIQYAVSGAGVVVEKQWVEVNGAKLVD